MKATSGESTTESSCENLLIGTLLKWLFCLESGLLATETCLGKSCPENVRARRIIMATSTWTVRDRANGRPGPLCQWMARQRLRWDSGRDWLARGMILCPHALSFSLSLSLARTVASCPACARAVPVSASGAAPLCPVGVIFAFVVVFL